MQVNYYQVVDGDRALLTAAQQTYVILGNIEQKVR
jgi:hypothetical protein